MFEDVLKTYGGVEVLAMDVYSEMFHLGEKMIQTNKEAKGEHKANPLGYWKNNKDTKGHYRILFDDTFEETIKEMQKADFCIVNGIAYFGRKNLQSHASKMYAMIFDLDGVTEETLRTFLHSAFAKDFKIYPLPNYIILSGHGIHLYYIFETPIPLYPNIKFQLKEMKYALTTKLWNRYTTTEWRNVQYQGINQGFRVIGGKTKIDGVKVRAFQMNTHPFSLGQLNEYIPQENRIDEAKLWKERKYTLAQAKEKFPEWYSEVVVNGGYQKWNIKEDLYYWWIGKIQEGASVGHRYFCIMTLTIYAVKCGIDREQLERDICGLMPYLYYLGGEDNPFTESDVVSALECFDERYRKFPRKDLEKITGIDIPPNKRNKRKRADHIKLMNYVRDEINGNKQWQNLDGRPKGTGTAQVKVQAWRAANPTGRKVDCAKETKLDPKTIRKWWGEK